MLTDLINEITFGEDYKPDLPYYATNKFNTSSQNSFSYIA